MALRMARPWKDPKTGVWHLRQRVPQDLVARLKGQLVTLPVGEDFATVRVGPVVQVSLRVKDATRAKELHAAADAALRRLYSAQRTGPMKLTHREAVALAGVLYRAQQDRIEAEGGNFNHAVAEAAKRIVGAAEAGGMGAAIAAMSSEGLDPKVAAALGERASPEAMEDVFGDIVDGLLTRQGLSIEDASRAVLVNEVRRAMLDGAGQIARKGRGDYGPDPNIARFPVWARPEKATVAREPSDTITAAELFSRWQSKQTKAPNTVRRYAASWRSFSAFVKSRDVRTLTDEDVHAWAVHRRDVEGVRPRVVNKNDLVAVSSVLSWASGLNGSRVLTANPAKGVRLEEPRHEREREKVFRVGEIAAILRAAADVKLNDRNPTLSYAQRWCPWIAAYSGARITEVAGLTVADVRYEGGVPVMDLRKTKTGVPRTVPLHDHLMELGFLEFVRSRGSGPLFFDPRRHTEGKTATPAELRGAKVAAWVRKVAELDPNVDPNHGWRHTFKTRALGAGIEERVRDAITGHSVRSVARGYEAPPVLTLAEALKRFPRYDL